MSDADKRIWCCRCDRELDPEKAVWLELNCETGQFQDPKAEDAEDWESTGETQGCFPFGADCAPMALKGESRNRWKGRAW